jgi:hypothetical protein
MDDDIGITRIELNGDWDLGTMGEAFRAYTQLYAAAHFLIGSSEPIPLRRSGETGQYSYPWRGGYSVVNLFRSLGAQLPKRFRPEVLEVTYASPGYIELVAACLAVSFVIRTITVSAHRLLNVYKDVQKEITKRGLNQLEERQRTAHVEFIEAAYGELTRTMALPDNAKARLQDATHEDPWARLKIVLALARRIETVAELTRAGIMSLNDATPLSQIRQESLSDEKQRKIGKLLASSAHSEGAPSLDPDDDGL